MTSQESGVPGGYGAVGRRGGGGRVIEPVVPPTYGVSGGYYTDPQGRQITREQAQASGTVDRPGEAAEKLRSIGGGATTTQIEQRFGIEEALKRGDITRPEAIELTRRNIEGRPLEITKTVEQRKDVRDTQAAEAYFRGLAAKRTGTAQQEAQRRQAIPERVFVTISGKRVPFVSRAQAEQRRPATRIQTKVTEAFAEKNVELSNILKYVTPAPVRNFIDSIDRRAQLSFKGQKPLNPFAFRNVAEAIYGIEKGAVKGVVEEPLTAATSLIVGGSLAKGAGVLSSKVPALSKTIFPEIKTVSKGQKISLYRAMFGSPKGVLITEPVLSTKIPSIGAGKVLKKITEKATPINIVSGVMAGYYGADVAKRIAAADNRAQTIGKILSTEIVPFVAGARFAQAPIGVTVRPTEYAARRLVRAQKSELKRFIKDENARMGADVWSKIPTQRQSALKQGKELKRTIQFGKTFTEPSGKGVTVVSGKQQLIAIQETKLKPHELKQVAITTQKQATVQLHKQIQVTQQQQIKITKQIQKQVFMVPTDQKQKIIYKQKQNQVSQQVQKAPQIQKQKIIPFTPQKMSYAISQVHNQQQKAPQIMKQIQKQVSVQKSVQKQITKQIQKQRTIQKKKTVLKPTTYINQLEDVAKASKKRGKFVWNIKNKIPTLESLIG